MTKKGQALGNELPDMMMSMGDVFCYRCEAQIPIGVTYLRDLTRHPQYGRKGGTFCRDCYNLLNPAKKEYGDNMSYEKLLKELGISSVNKFSEVCPDEKPWDTTHTEMLNLPMVVVSIAEVKTRYGQALIGSCVTEKGLLNVLFGGEVLIEKLNQIRDKLPVELTIRKIGKYYAFE